MLNLLCLVKPSFSFAPRTCNYISRISKIVFILCLVFNAISTETAFAIDDFSAPVLVDLSFDKQSIDVSGGPETVTATIRVTDDLSGFSWASFYFRSTSGQQSLYFGFMSSDLVSGDEFDGVYQRSQEFPQFSESGLWRVTQVQLLDKVGNEVNIYEEVIVASGVQATIEITSVGDISDPILVDLSFDKQSIDVSAGPQTVTATIRVTDDLSGFNRGLITAHNPSGDQVQGWWFEADSRVSGDEFDGVYEVSTEFPQLSESETWRITEVHLSDKIGNLNFINEAEFANSGFQTTIEINPVVGFEIFLYEGWNLISFPVLPTDSSPGNVLSDVLGDVQAVWGYDGESKLWSSYSPDAPSSLSEFELGMGYWVKVDQTVTLTIPEAP